MNIPLFTSSVKKQAYCEKKSVELLRSSYHQQDHLNVVVNRDVISYCWCSADNKTKTLEEVENCDSPQKTLWGNYFTKKYHLNLHFNSAVSTKVRFQYFWLRVFRQLRLLNNIWHIWGVKSLLTWDWMNVEEGLQIENRTLCFILEKMYIFF